MFDISKKNIGLFFMIVGAGFLLYALGLPLKALIFICALAMIICGFILTGYYQKMIEKTVTLSLHSTL